MLGAIINLVFNSFVTGFAIIGAGTFINKAGDFFKILETEKNDAYKKAFDSVMVESISDINKSVDSMQFISRNLYKITFLIIDLVNGAKYIKKNKDGKLIICDKSNVSITYKEKIDNLKNKVKKYQEQLSKVAGINFSEEEEDDNEDDDIDFEAEKEITETSFAPTSNNEFFLEKNKDKNE
jgi:hypothetical protein